MRSSIWEDWQNQHTLSAPRFQEGVFDEAPLCLLSFSTIDDRTKMTHTFDSSTKMTYTASRSEHIPSHHSVFWQNMRGPSLLMATGRWYSLPVCVRSGENEPTQSAQKWITHTRV